MKASEEYFPQAVEYLRASPDGFWKWEDDRPTVAWSDGKTIAFREEIVAVLERLAPLGLPPFNAVILLLAASRGGFDDTPSRRDVLRRYAQQIGLIDAETLPRTTAGAIGSVVQQKLSAGFRAVVGGLARVAAYPPDLRGTLALRRLLAETVFEGASRGLKPEIAAVVPAVLRNSVEFERTGPACSGAENLGRLAETLDALLGGLERLNADSFRLRIKAGLDELPRPAPLPATPQTVRDLLAGLRNDSELGGLARMAQNLMAAVHVPRSLSAHEDMPLGGVSDLSNRGTFDRLLLSELAHDDLTLAVRVAMNEALYLRRESPPRRPPPSRTILIDCGIRLWGLPRSFAAAAALALAATSDPQGEVHVYRAAQSGPARVDLHSREGLVALLGTLEPDPQPGDSLRALMDPDQFPAEQSAETLLITHPDALSDPEFARTTEGKVPDLWYAATVERDGSFALLACTRAGRKPVTQAKVSLEEIFTNRAATPLVAKDFDPNLPAFLSVSPSQLRLSARIQSRFAVTSKRYGAMGITHDGRLVQFESNVRGGRELCARLPAAARRLGFFVDETRGHLLGVAHSRNKWKLYLTHVDLETAQVVHSELTADSPLHVWHRSGLLFMAYRRQIVARQPESGEVVSVYQAQKDLSWIRDRFCSLDGGIGAVGYDGMAIRFYPVTPLHRVTPFDRDDSGGPWLLTPHGEFQAAEGSAVIKSGLAFVPRHGEARFSADGNRIVAATVRAALFRIDLAGDQEWIKSEGDEDAWLAGPALSWSQQSSVQLRWRFDAVCVDLQGTLRLLRRETDTQSFCFHLNAKGEMWLRPEGHTAVQRSMIKPFTRQKSPEGCHYSMRVALFSDGSRVYLDSRGLLHLKSVDRAFPELTLTLSNVGVAGWTSEGQTFGWAYFLDGRPSTTAAYAHDLLSRFARRLA